MGGSPNTYYNVVEIDDNQRPSKIELGPYIDQKFSNFLQDYKMQNIDDTWKPHPVYFEDINIFGDPELSDMDKLEAEGYVRVWNKHHSIKIDKINLS